LSNRSRTREGSKRRDIVSADVIQLIDGYKRLLLAAKPVDGDDANYKSIIVVFTDLPAAQAKDFFGGILEQIGVASYVDDGLVMGPFYEGNDGTALYNPNFRPFTSPVPFLLMRRAVTYLLEEGRQRHGENLP